MMLMSKIIILTGPTASGKTSLAIEFAQKYKKTAILNADSLQVYKEIPIITAQPTLDEMCAAEHFMYGIASVNDSFNVNVWLDILKKELEKLSKIFDFILIVGGSTMYIRRLIDGLYEIDEISSVNKQEVNHFIINNGLKAAWDELVSFDNRFHAISQNDTLRITRAMEVKHQTGLSIYDFKNSESILKGYDVTKIALMPKRNVVYDACNKRFDDMVANGVLDEVEQFMKISNDENKTPYGASGMKELIGYIKGETSIDFAIEKAKQSTRNYVKRQSTWINNKFTDFNVIDEKNLGLLARKVITF